MSTLIIAAMVFLLWGGAATEGVPGFDGSPNHQELGVAPYDLNTLPLGASATIVVVLSAECDDCVASIPFYKRLLKELDGERGKLIVVARDGVWPVKNVLDSHDFKPHHLTSGPYPARSVPGVGNTSPTLLVVDPKGKVDGTWSGRLPASQENQVMAAVNRLQAQTPSRGSKQQTGE
ncbi:MAG TPA: hypothetical protein VGD94_00515 [Vicinamibacterales bacterium]